MWLLVLRQESRRLRIRCWQCHSFSPPGCFQTNRILDERNTMHALHNFITFYCSQRTGRSKVTRTYGAVKKPGDGKGRHCMRNVVATLAVARLALASLALARHGPL